VKSKVAEQRRQANATQLSIWAVKTEEDNRRHLLLAASHLLDQVACSRRRFGLVSWFAFIVCCCARRAMKMKGSHEKS